ncbi:hypothetical protein J2W21_001709 [Sinomonas atrocyanea]|uniref:histone-like nucleoid-structuring protein Lsr2 n=1 Tax=Sinomonas atrocyanea TaxID=37927 RepID=UPI002785D927|nr:Lsr2 family protein [Sinomonas atrocyanea]MDP9884199.1 hypothetical protein [Sinomonas atrocyanea]
MARTVIITLVDDLDGSEADQTVSFSLDGRHYEIDLNADNAAQLRESLAGFVQAARRRGPQRATPRRAAGQPPQRAVRDWADANGIEVSSRGRIPQSILDQYTAAQN